MLGGPAAAAASGSYAGHVANKNRRENLLTNEALDAIAAEVARSGSPVIPIRPVVHADGTPVSYDIEAAIRSAPYIPTGKSEHLRLREIGRLNVILARAFYREAWHGGFW